MLLLGGLRSGSQFCLTISGVSITLLTPPGMLNIVPGTWYEDRVGYLVHVPSITKLFARAWHRLTNHRSGLYSDDHNTLLLSYIILVNDVARFDACGAGGGRW